MRAVLFSAAKLEGDVVVPGSKSQTVRAFVVATLARGTSRIHGVSLSDDVESVTSACRALGAKVEEMKKCGCKVNTPQGTRQTLKNKKLCFSVTSKGPPFDVSAFLPVPGFRRAMQPQEKKIFTGDSGITTHFTLPLLGLTRSPSLTTVFDSGPQMRKRHIERFFPTLQKLGMNIQSGTDGGWPLQVSGRLTGGKTQVWGGTSQYVSALLLCGMYAEQDLHITVRDLCEKSYVQMTLEWLKKFGIQYQCTLDEQEGASSKGLFNTDARHFSAHVPAQQKYAPFEYTVPADFSSAAAIMAAAVICNGKVQLYGLNKNDSQPDKEIVTILQKMGANITVKPDRITGSEIITVRGGRALRGMNIDAGDIPDLVPILAVVGTQASGTTRISGVKHARFKETDRLHSMAVELEKMGADIQETEDGLVVRGAGSLQKQKAYVLHAAEVDGHGDHRTVMALAVAGLVAGGKAGHGRNTKKSEKTFLSGAEAVAKTYPDFWDDLAALGVKVEYQKSAPGIILIGFKGVGKSTVGRAVAKKLGRPFYDLDDAIEKQYARECSSHGALHTSHTLLSCREIFTKHGEKFFRELEHQTLKSLLKTISQSHKNHKSSNIDDEEIDHEKAGSTMKPFVLAVGGGAVLLKKNQQLLKALQSQHSTCILHLTAPPQTVLKRIIQQGRPAFFPAKLSDQEAFQKVWEKRMPVYESLAGITVQNSGTLKKTVETIAKKIGNILFS